MTEYFPEPPEKPNMIMEHIHEHDWYQIGAKENPNGTWWALFACEHCPDIGLGGKTGPIPPGWCPCGWVQKKWPRKRCEECGRRFNKESND